MKVYAFSLRVVVFYWILDILFYFKTSECNMYLLTQLEYSISHCNICILHCDWYSSLPIFAFWISDDCLLKCVQLRQVYFGCALHLIFDTHNAAVYFLILSAFEYIVCFCAFVYIVCFCASVLSGVSIELWRVGDVCWVSLRSHNHISTI